MTQPGGAYVQRYSQLLKKLLAAKSGEPIEGLAPELLATLVLENDPPEYKYLSGKKLWAGTINSPLNAGKNSSAYISNPSKSGIVVVVEGFEVVSPATVGSLMEVRTRVAAGAATNTTFFRDSRDGFGGGCPVGIQGDNTQLAAALGNGPVLIFAADAIVLPVPFVLSPGFDFVIDDATVAEAIRVSFWGYFREIEASEF